MVETVIDPINDRPVSEDRGETAPAGFEQAFRPADVEEALMLSGEARGRKILGRRGAADRHGTTAPILRLQQSIPVGDLPAQFLTVGRGVDDLARQGRSIHENIHVACVETIKKLTELGLGACLGQCIAIGGCGEGKPIWHPDILDRQRRIEFTEGSVLPADERDVFEPDVTEPTDVARSRHRPSLRSPMLREDPALA